MKREIAYRKNGEKVNVLIPETPDDLVELQKLYDAGKLQAGEHVKPAATK